MSRGGWLRWSKVSRARPRRSSWDHLVCSVWRIEGWGEPSLQSTPPSRGAAERGVLISSLWWPAIGHEEKEWSCFRGSSDWTLGKGSSLRGRSVTGTDSPGQWSWYPACQSSRSVWMMLLVIWFGCRWSCKEQGVGLGDPYGSLPAWDILWKLSCKQNYSVFVSVSCSIVFWGLTCSHIQVPCIYKYVISIKVKYKLICEHLSQLLNHPTKKQNNQSTYAGNMGEF